MSKKLAWRRDVHSFSPNTRGAATGHACHDWPGGSTKDYPFLKGRFGADQTMLPNSYKEALKGFKGQAAAATALLAGQDKKSARAELNAAQRLMAANTHATQDIYRLLMNSERGLTIDTLDEDRLEEELGEDYLSQFSDAAA